MLWNAFLLALRELRRNKMRSFLTMLGIIIGVAAVITLVTLGGGATQQVTQQIAGLGSNLLMINPGKHMGPGQSSGAAPFKLADAEALARDVPELAAVAPTVGGSMTAILANENWSTQVTGTTEDYFTINNRKIRTGRIFSAGEVRSGTAVCVIGETVRNKLFGSRDPIGSRIRLNKLSCEVIGLLEPKGQSSMGRDQDDVVVVPLRTYQRRVAGNTDVSMIQVSVRDGVSTESAEKKISQLLRVRRHLSSNEDDNFDVMDMKEIAKMLTGTTKLLTSLLGAVAAVSLLVGGIGIMNIMLVSVTERTREIGLRMAIGATPGDILLQFITEAMVLSTVGGVIGALVGIIGAQTVGHVQNWPILITQSSVIVAFLFSAAIGVFFGFYPALRASRLNPIDCLRYE